MTGRRLSALLAAGLLGLAAPALAQDAAPDACRVTCAGGACTVACAPEPAPPEGSRLADRIDRIEARAAERAEAVVAEGGPREAQRLLFLDARLEARIQRLMERYGADPDNPAPFEDEADEAPLDAPPAPAE